MDYMLMPLRRYADFQGRSQRKEYWMFVLLQIIVGLVLVVLAGISGAIGGNASPFYSAVVIGILALIYGVLFLIPTLAAQVRRFHDQDKSGWLVLLALIPYIGGTVVLVFMCLDGTHGPNRFGPDPKGQAPVDTFA